MGLRIFEKCLKGVFCRKLVVRLGLGVIFGERGVGDMGFINVAKKRYVNASFHPPKNTPPMVKPREK